MTTAYQELPLEQLHESKHNPRQHFDGPAMDELVASVLQVGILDPLIVRPNAKGFEIAAGHRRYRAAKTAKLPTVPCRVRELTDQQFMEILTISNLQREDVHPLDEAQGYEALMAAPYKMKVDALAQKVGKSVKYVYDRIKLLALTRPARDLFWAGTIEAGHAILLARLTPSEQAKVIGGRPGGRSVYDPHCGGLLRACHGLYDADAGHDNAHVTAVSVRELEDWIKRHIRFKAVQADAFLFPETVQQVTEASKAKTKIIEITREYLANDDVRHADKAKVYGARAWKRADGNDASKTCERSVLGVIVSGPGQGEAFLVCVNKDRCTVHWGKEIKARAHRQKAAAKGDMKAVSKADTKYAEQQRRQNEGYEREKRKRTEWDKLTPAVITAVEAKLPSISTKATGPLGDLLVKAVNRFGPWRTAIPRGKSADDLIRHLAGLALHSEASDFYSYDKFPKLAKHLGVDLSAILNPMPALATSKVTKVTPAKKRKAA